MITEDDIRIEVKECVDSHACEFVRKGDMHLTRLHTPIYIKKNLTTKEAEQLKQQILQALQLEKAVREQLEECKIRSNSIVIQESQCNQFATIILQQLLGTPKEFVEPHNTQEPLGDKA